jgi:trimethylamine:corrinoid methyltransferase-like protein
MPMPIMGLTAPVGLSTTLGTAEVLAISSSRPPLRHPFIYARPRADGPARSLGGGAVGTLLGATITEVGALRLPVEASSGSSDAHVPGIQASYERATTWLLAVLGWPDLLVGPGCVGGSTILSPEPLVLDLEVFRRCERLHRGIADAATEAVEAAVADAGHGGDFLARRATRDAVHAGEWYVDRLAPDRSSVGTPPDDRPARGEASIARRSRPTSRLLDDATSRELARIERAARGRHLRHDSRHDPRHAERRDKRQDDGPSRAG